MLVYINMLTTKAINFAKAALGKLPHNSTRMGDFRLAESKLNQTKTTTSSTVKPAPKRAPAKPKTVTSPTRQPDPPKPQPVVPKKVVIPDPPKPPAKPPQEPVQPVKTNQVQVNKYEYMLGVYNLEVKESGYNPAGIYVSKPFNVDGNAIEVRLNTKEHHPLFDISGDVIHRQTAIEYYITYSDDATSTEWIPILPEGVKEVRNELLLLRQSPTAELVFTARRDKPITVYRNGKKISSRLWSIDPSLKRITLVDAEFDPGSLYSVDYSPDETARNPWAINFIDQGLRPRTFIETFTEGTNRNGVLYLSRRPYINQARLTDPNYQPVRVTLYDSHIAGPGGKTFKEVQPILEPTSSDLAYTKNITNYIGEMQPNLTPYSLVPNDNGQYHLNFEYLHAGNRLYFGETFRGTEIETNQSVNHGNAKIRVEYQLLSPSIRLKAIFRNMSSTRSVTPLLQEYTLKFYVVR